MNWKDTVLGFAGTLIIILLGMIGFFAKEMHNDFSELKVSVNKAVQQMVVDEVRNEDDHVQMKKDIEKNETDIKENRKRIYQLELNRR